MSQTKRHSVAASSTPEHQAYLALQRVALHLRDETEQFFKQEGLTATQFNVLRILLGAEDDALTCGDIAGRLLNKDPDVTRLLDRMEKQGLVERFRSEQDRRVLFTRLSPQGREVVQRLQTPLMQLHQRQFGSLPANRLQLLQGLLEEMSAPNP